MHMHASVLILHNKRGDLIRPPCTSSFFSVTADVSLCYLQLCAQSDCRDDSVWINLSCQVLFLMQRCFYSGLCFHFSCLKTQFHDSKHSVELCDVHTNPVVLLPLGFFRLNKEIVKRPELSRMRNE